MSKLYIFAASVAAIKHPAAKSNGSGIPQKTSLFHGVLIAVGRDEEHVKELLEPVVDGMFPITDGYSDQSVAVSRIAVAARGQAAGVRVPS